MLVYYAREQVVLLVTAYAKGRKEDSTMAEKRAIATLIDEVGQHLRLLNEQD